MSEDVICLFKDHTPDGGMIRLEHWPEGYVLWWHGRIQFRSWTVEPTKEQRVQRVVDAVVSGSGLFEAAADLCRPSVASPSRLERES
jgi:hypothetical protein